MHKLTSLHDKAMEYINKSLSIRKEIGDRKGEATDYRYAGKVCYSVGEYADGKNFAQKALAIQKEISDRKGEASCYHSFAIFFCHQGQYAKAVQCRKLSMGMCRWTVITFKI